MNRILSCLAVVSAAGICRAQLYPGTNHYYQLTPQRGTWIEAEAMAEQMGGHLAGPHNWVDPTLSNWIQLVFATPVVLWAQRSGATLGTPAPPIVCPPSTSRSTHRSER